MGRKARYSAEEKISAVQEYLDGKGSMKTIAQRLGIAFQSFKQWVKNYEAMGIDAFKTNHNKHYSKAEKEQAVAAYLAGEGSHMEICQKFKILSTSQLKSWIKKYNGHETLKSSGTGGIAIMTQGRKTTFDERVEIVQYCITHDHNYAETSAKYNVSYQQTRSYTVKYEAGGIEALRDRRGRTKPLDEMSELEKLRAENRILRAEKERAEMEASFLKKLDEIERRRG